MFFFLGGIKDIIFCNVEFRTRFISKNNINNDKKVTEDDVTYFAEVLNAGDVSLLDAIAVDVNMDDKVDMSDVEALMDMREWL